MQYSLPAIIASLATSLYNIIDSVFIGRGVGAMAITGLAITFPLMNLVVAFCVLVAVGGATISSIFLGQKAPEKASQVVGNVTVFCLIHAVVIMSVGLLFLDPILYFFGATAETIGYALSFMRIILFGTPISYVFLGLNNLMRATGYPRKAMISALLSVAINIVVAPLLIFVAGWGISGAALATICGQTSAFIWVLHHFISRKSYIRFTLRGWHVSWTLMRKIYAIGLSAFSYELLRLPRGGVYQQSTARYGRHRRQPCRRRVRDYQPYDHVLRDDNIRHHAGHAAYFGI